MYVSSVQFEEFRHFKVITYIDFRNTKHLHNFFRPGWMSITQQKIGYKDKMYRYSDIRLETRIKRDTAT